MSRPEKLDPSPSRRARVSARAVVGIVLSVAMPPALLFAAAGHVDWWRGWAWAFFSLAVGWGSRALLTRRSPDLLAERSRYRELEGVPAWDRVLVSLIATWTPLATLIVAGLDERFGWRPDVTWEASVAGLAAAALGAALGTWAMISNPFFSAVVRFQEDRGHRVCREGPYRVVRHPGYAGGLLTSLATPIALGSLWALVPAALTALALIVRTVLEDRFLCDRLKGYREYVVSTPKRLVPGVW